MPNQYVNKVVQSNGTTLIDISDTTAIASDVASGKYFYLATGEKVVGTASSGGSSATLITKTITENGTYSASDDSADGYSSVTVNVTSSGETTVTVTGTVTGNGSNVLQIPCDFEPDLIYINGDLSADVANRGIVSVTIIKDMAIYFGYDSSTSASRTDLSGILNITGYNETDASSIHATYSNNVLSVDTVVNSGSVRWPSGITYSYKLIKFG